MVIDSGKLTYTCDKEPPFLTTKEELKKDDDRKEWENVIYQSWRRMYKKRGLASNL